MATDNNSKFYQAYFSVNRKFQNPRKRMRELELNEKESLFQQKKMIRMDQVNFFKSCLPQILLGPFLNTY